MNKLNIIIDVSHLSNKSFLETLELSNKPIVATHSCVYNICNHRRNLTDEQIKKIARVNGVIGICFYKDFLKSSNFTISTDDIVKHIDYIVNLVGIDYVGIGSDFDGMEKDDLPNDLKSTKNLNLIFLLIDFPYESPVGYGLAIRIGIDTPEDIFLSGEAEFEIYPEEEKLDCVIEFKTDNGVVFDSTKKKVTNNSKVCFEIPEDKPLKEIVFFFSAHNNPDKKAEVCIKKISLI